MKTFLQTIQAIVGFVLGALILLFLAAILTFWLPVWCVFAIIYRLIDDAYKLFEQVT